MGEHKRNFHRSLIEFQLSLAGVVIEGKVLFFLSCQFINMKISSKYQ